jgi:RHS repeat-associated protein
VLNYKQYEPFGAELLDTFKLTRQGYIGKEKDEENGLGDHGVRKYDPATGNFKSCDPLSDKFPGRSPYLYCFNNPVNLMDYNGKNAVAIVDGDKITVKAMYAVSNYSADQIKSMNKDINEYLNNAKYVVSKGAYAGKSVQFDLAFVAEGSDERFKTESSIGGFDISNTLDHRSNGKTHNITTTWSIDFTEKKLSSTKYSTTGGITGEHQWIFMNDKYDNFRTRIHEIFHTFFFDYDDASSGIGNYVPGKDMPNQDDINNLINNSKLPAK